MGVKEISFSVIYIIVALLIVRISWYAINPILSMWEGNTFMLSLAWVSLFLAFILLVFFAPIYAIINNSIPNLYYIGKAVISIFIGMIITRISWALIPPLLSIINTTNTTQASIMWIFLILLWVITMIIVPVHFAQESTKL